MAGSHAQAQSSGTATDITGLYNTGQVSGGGGSTDSEWNVTYASTDGGTNYAYDNNGTISGTLSDQQYVGAAYVTDAYNSSTGWSNNSGNQDYLGGGYVADQNNAQWIAAPGAYDTTSTSSGENNGGDNLPGNGNKGSNEGIYVYTLAFTIEGYGSVGTTVTNNIQITMTIAADDQYAVYVNPAGNGTTLPTGTPAASATSAWTNTTQIALQNYGSGGANNSKFKIGVNYISVVVDNTNSVNGSSSSTALNPSGVMVYETADAEVGGHPVPEVGTWLPLIGAIGCYGFVLLRRRRARLQPACA